MHSAPDHGSWTCRVREPGRRLTPDEWALECFGAGVLWQGLKTGYRNHPALRMASILALAEAFDRQDDRDRDRGCCWVRANGGTVLCGRPRPCPIHEPIPVVTIDDRTMWGV